MHGTLPHPLLTARTLPTVLRIAGPTTAVMVMQSGVTIAELFFVGRLGTSALAGFQLVFPFVMLMTMMAAGGIGGGIASAVARALGAGDRARAASLAVHALLIAAGFALLWTAAMSLAGPAIYRAFGASGETLRFALAYSTTLFAGAVAPWAMFALSSILRGTGDAVTPGKFMLLGSLLQVPLSAVLVLGTAPWGLGSWTGIGIEGAAISMIATSLLSAALMAWRLWSGRTGFTPSLAGQGLAASAWAPILKIGLISSMSALLANTTTMLVNFAIKPFGDAAIAGYGIGARLEFILVPLSFGIGAALTTLVGIAAGAGQWDRARHVAWTGGLMAAALTGTLGIVVALFPGAWAGLFSSDPAVLQAATQYLTRAAPFYAFFGLGMSLNFAAQGASRMKVPFIASLLRTLVAGVGGYLLVTVWHGSLPDLFWLVGLAILLYGTLIGGALALRPWRAR
ncbi:MAG TPA: MATE family efflux transporter [Vineibacter sp.]|nr:MATE family efflux transporter [Vineibacter sp.]